MAAKHTIPGPIEQYGRRSLPTVENNLDNANLSTRCPLDNGRHHGQPKYRAGKLELLAPELVFEVLLYLDVPSLTTFRRVNRRAAQLVDSLHQYQMIYTHCPDILRAIISINARHYDLWHLFKTLSKTRCSTCPRFGGYLYLITCQRVCCSCFNSDLTYNPMASTAAAKLTHLRKEKLKSLIPCVLSLPGTYTPWERQSKKRIMLFDRQVVYDNDLDGYLSMRTMAHFDEPNTRDAQLYMSTISAPYFTSSAPPVDWGFHCNNCIDSGDEVSKEMSFRIKYTKDELKRHMERYGIDHGERPSPDPYSWRRLAPYYPSPPHVSQYDAA